MTAQKSDDAYGVAGGVSSAAFATVLKVEKQCAIPAAQEEANNSRRCRLVLGSNSGF